MILMLIINEKSLPTTSLSLILLSDNPHHQAVGWGSRGGYPATWSAQGFLKIDSSFFIFDPSCFIFQSSFSYLSWSRPERWIVTIPSSDQWLATIGNHWKTIATNGFGDQNHWKTIASNGFWTKIHWKTIDINGDFPSIHSMTMVSIKTFYSPLLSHPKPSQCTR